MPRVFKHVSMFLHIPVQSHHYSHPTLSYSHVNTTRSRQLARQHGQRATRAPFFLDFSRPSLVLSLPPFLIVPLLPSHHHHVRRNLNSAEDGLSECCSEAWEWVWGAQCCCEPFKGGRIFKWRLHGSNGPDELFGSWFQMGCSLWISFNLRREGAKEQSPEKLSREKGCMCASLSVLPT